MPSAPPQRDVPTAALYTGMSGRTDTPIWGYSDLVPLTLFETPLSCQQVCQALTPEKLTALWDVVQTAYESLKSPTACRYNLHW